MSHLSRLVPLIALALLSIPGSTLADTPRGQHDYSRYSNGPRQVPTPRGASQARAEALGLGTRRAAGTLLSRRPSETWVAAATGLAPTTLAWPVPEGHFGRGFGFTRRERRDLRHNGIDIGAPTGTEVQSVADGIVGYSDNGIRGYGNCVLVLHPNGWVSLYAHLSRATVQPGWRVRRGERIGLVGATGIARGPHLHFELRMAGRVRDPAPLFDHIPRRGRRRSTSHAVATGPTRAPGTAQTLTIGSRRLERSLRRHGPSQALLDAAAGRQFRSLLWPVRGGEQVARRNGRRALGIRAPAAPIRAAADGLVVYAGPIRNRKAVVVVHPNGWVTRYETRGSIDVHSGDRVLRGQWIGRVGSGTRQAARMRFSLRDDGVARDPRPLLVQVPSGAT